MAIITEKYTKDRQLSPHFALHEFRCKSGADTLKWCEETVALLEKIFDKCSKISKAIITSGYRTPEYSVKVGGTKDDGHTVGIAVDVKWYDKQNHIIPPKYIACIAQEVGFTGIGIMKNSIHLDTRTTKNYKNGKWWGDETNGKNGIKDFFAYFGLTREEVYKVLGVVTEKAEEKPVEPSKAETLKPQAVAPETPKDKATTIVPEESMVEVPEEEVSEYPIIEAPTVTITITEADVEEGDVDEVVSKETAGGLLAQILKLIVKLINLIFKKEK